MVPRHPPPVHAPARPDPPPPAQVNSFYAAKEKELGERLGALAPTLANPTEWTLRPVEVDDVSLDKIAAVIVDGVHVPARQGAALRAFVVLCDEIDQLRKFSVLNHLAVTKILKKHDKNSRIRLRGAVLPFVTGKDENAGPGQAFYTSTALATAFTHAQCVASEIVAALTSSSVAKSDDYSCCICLDVLNMPVVLSCAHRFCYACLRAASDHEHASCPLCKKETDLDPANFHIDPVLSRFVDVHFVEHRRDATCQPADAPDATAEPSVPGLPRQPKQLAPCCSSPACSPRGPGGSMAAEPDPCGESGESGGKGRARTSPPRGRSIAESAAPPRGKSIAESAAADVPVSDPPPKRRKACVECHKAKAACEGDPCTRCVRLGRKCVTVERKKRTPKAAMAAARQSSLAQGIREAPAQMFDSLQETMIAGAFTTDEIESLFTDADGIVHGL